MDSQMAGNMVSLDANCFAILPMAAKGEVSSRFAPNMAIAKMAVEGLRIRKQFRAGRLLPFAL